MERSAIRELRSRISLRSMRRQRSHRPQHVLGFAVGVWYNIATLRPAEEIAMQLRGANHEQVYRVLRSAQGLMTAYEILDAVRPKGISAPPTVYRALNRLMHEGELVQSLTKKLSRRGFVADRATIEIQGLCASCAPT